MQSLTPRVVLFAAVCWFAPAVAAQQELPAAEVGTLRAPGQAAGFDYSVQLPAGFTAAEFRPVVVLLGNVSADADRQQSLLLARAIAQRGMVVAVPHALSADPAVDGAVRAHPALLRLPAQLRQRFRIAQGGMHLAAVGNAGAAAVDLAAAVAWEFQSVSLFGGARGVDATVLAKLPGRRLAWFTDQPSLPAADGAPPARAVVARRPAVPSGQLLAAVPDHLAALHAARDLDGPAGEVARALDDFHDAAAKGDAERYFALLPEDAVFLGTDGAERWTGAQFRDFAMPHFRRGSAWTFVPVVRHVEVGAGGALAWFDEQLDNQPYGECRGSGVLERRAGRWVVRHYNLTIPVPNDLARGVVARIRDFAIGLPPATTTVVLVRHAERGAGDDPELTEAGQARAERLAAMLADLPITAVFASEYRRTQATVAPLCRARGLTAKVVPAADANALAQQVQQHGARRAVLVAAHSNTMPAILKALGVDGEVSVADDDFGALFVVTLSADGARVLRLHY